MDVSSSFAKIREDEQTARRRGIYREIGFIYLFISVISTLIYIDFLREK